MRARVLAFAVLIASVVGLGLVLADDRPAPSGGPDPAAPPPLGAQRLSRAEGEKIASGLLAAWKARTGRDWTIDEKEDHEIVPPFDNSVLLEGEQGAGQVYGRVTPEDIARWAREVETVVLTGSRVFHSAEALGSTNSVSCDMCHPHGANTHAETYPKFQTQAGRVLLLRDMVNWCLTNPVRAKAWDADDPRMRAVEAYLLAQRRGKELQYGKH